uniref:Uncharacterized protein n=1 Tax=Streptomyces sp. NBC_00003 TaxID=2903608 RepID=A0AAU2UYM1_9ACTN
MRVRTGGIGGEDVRFRGCACGPGKPSADSTHTSPHHEPPEAAFDWLLLP